MACKWIVNDLVFAGATYEGFKDDGQKTPIVRPQLFMVVAEFMKHPIQAQDRHCQSPSWQKIERLQDPKLQQLTKQKLKMIKDSHAKEIRLALENPSSEEHVFDDPENIVGAKALVYMGTVDEFPEILDMARKEGENNLYYSERREDFAERGIAPVHNTSYDRFLALEAIDLEGLENTLLENGEGRWQISQQLQIGWKVLGQLVQRWREKKQMRGKDLAELSTATRQWYTFKGENAVIEFLKRITETILADAGDYIRKCVHSNCNNFFMVRSQIECLDPDRVGFTRTVSNRKFCDYRCRRSHENRTHYARKQKEID